MTGWSTDLWIIGSALLKGEDFKKNFFGDSQSVSLFSCMAAYQYH